MLGQESLCPIDSLHFLIRVLLFEIIVWYFVYYNNKRRSENRYKKRGLEGDEAMKSIQRFLTEQQKKLQIVLVVIALTVCVVTYVTVQTGFWYKDHGIMAVKEQLEGHGIIVSTSADQIQNAIVEHIVLYSQEQDGSHNKIQRNGILVRYPDAVGTVVLCHGLMCDKEDEAFLRNLFPRGVYNIMSFDFRAHGENRKGQVCTLGKDESFDVIAAGKFLKQHSAVKNLPLYVYGFSMGAVAAIEAQSKEPDLFHAMILDCPFDSSTNVLKRGLENLKVSLFGYKIDLPGKQLLEKYSFHPYVQSFVRALLKAIANLDARDIPLRVPPFSPAISAEKIKVPILFIHCKKDEKVPIEAVTKVYSSVASEYKILWLTNGSKHFGSYFHNPERYTDKVRGFLDLAIAGDLYTIKRNEIIEDQEEQKKM